jgi:very-short-patch-repair endonuclease
MRTNMPGLTNALSATESERNGDATVAIARALRREMSRQERVLWKALRGNALDGLHFRRQHIICGYIVDFYCHRARLAIEVDGPIHDRNPEEDELRDRFLSQQGISVLHIPAKAIDLSPDSVLWLIRQHTQNGVNPDSASPIAQKS